MYAKFWWFFYLFLASYYGWGSRSPAYLFMPHQILHAIWYVDFTTTTTTTTTTTSRLWFLLCFKVVFHLNKKKRKKKKKHPFVISVSSFPSHYFHPSIHQLFHLFFFTSVILTKKKSAKRKKKIWQLNIYLAVFKYLFFNTHFLLFPSFPPPPLQLTSLIPERKKFFF